MKMGLKLRVVIENSNVALRCSRILSYASSSLRFLILLGILIIIQNRFSTTELYHHFPNVLITLCTIYALLFS